MSALTNSFFDEIRSRVDRYALSTDFNSISKYFGEKNGVVISTLHGVKGEEYDNVVFVISKGWNLYQFETYAPMITGHSPVPKGKEASFERNRNLFYVCCSRPKKRLFLFVTIPVEPVFKTFLIDLIGEDNIYTYSQFLKTTP